MVQLPPIGLGTANLMQVGLPEFIDIASRHGFRRITARPWVFAETLRGGMTETELQDRLAAAGVEVTTIDALTGVLPGVQSASTLDAETRQRMPPDVLEPPSEEACFHAAVVLGAPWVNLTHYLGEPQPLEALAEALAGVGRRAADHGLRITVEFIPGTGLPDLPFTQAVVEACGAPNVDVLLDFFHFDRSGGTVDDIRKLPSDAIGGIQLSDRIPPPPGTAAVPWRGRVLPGDGQLPTHELVRAALENSPGATLDLEVLNEELQSLPPEVAAARLAASAAEWAAAF